MFIQIIQGKCSRQEELRAAFERWRRDVEPGAIGYLGGTYGFTDDGEMVAVVRFESRQAAMENSARPEQGMWWKDIEQLFDGPIEFHDCDRVVMMMDGGSDQAGFVQVIRGRMDDPDALESGMREMETMLHEARRTGMAEAFDAAARYCRRHIEVAWDDVYGGLYRTLMHVDDNRWALDKVGWVQQEALIGLLAVLEGRRHAWAQEWFNRVDDYNERTFARTTASRSPWKTNIDRTGALDLSPGRVEHYHYPRALIFNLLAVERIAAQPRTARSGGTRRLGLMAVARGTP